MLAPCPLTWTSFNKTQVNRGFSRTFDDPSPPAGTEPLAYLAMHGSSTEEKFLDRREILREN